MKKQISISKTGKYSQIGKSSKKINNVWIVLHGYGMLSEYFVKKFECITDETTLVIAPEATNRFYLGDNYSRVGASWMTKLDREQEIRDNILFLDLTILSPVFIIQKQPVPYVFLISPSFMHNCPNSAAC